MYYIINITRWRLSNKESKARKQQFRQCIHFRSAQRFVLVRKPCCAKTNIKKQYIHACTRNLERSIVRKGFAYEQNCRDTIRWQLSEIRQHRHRKPQQCYSAPMKRIWKKSELSWFDIGIIKKYQGYKSQYFNKSVDDESAIQTKEQNVADSEHFYFFSYEEWHMDTCISSLKFWML